MRSLCVATLWELKVTVGEVGCALVMDRRRRRRSAVPLPMSPPSRPEKCSAAGLAPRVPKLAPNKQQSANVRATFWAYFSFLLHTRTAILGIFDGHGAFLHY